jgi:membrane-associated HD superfamily phosphohydrolase
MGLPNYPAYMHWLPNNPVWGNLANLLVGLTRMVVETLPDEIFRNWKHHSIEKCFLYNFCTLSFFLSIKEKKFWAKKHKSKFFCANLLLLTLIKISDFLFNQYIPREIYFYSLQRQSTLVIWIITKRIFISFFRFIITSGICWNEKNLLMTKWLTRSFFIE